jgi:hypothetical protein
MPTTNNEVKYEDNKKIKMSRKYQLNGAMTDELQMREPTFGDELNVADVKPSIQNATMFANLCDITVDEMKQFAGKDMKKVIETYESFLS